MATIHDVMPAFELFQPTSIDDTLSLLERHRRSVWVLAGGLDTFDWLKDRNKRPSVVIDLSGVEALRGIKALPDGGLEIGATTTLTEIANHSVVQGEVQAARRCGGARRIAADSQPGHARRQRLAGHALLVLPQRLDLLSRGRQHLLRRHADGDQPRARAVRREPLRRGEPVRHGAGARRARRADGDSQLGRRARGARRRVLHRAVDRHHPHDGDGAGRPARRRFASRPRGRARSSTSRRCAIVRCGTSRS